MANVTITLTPSILRDRLGLSRGYASDLLNGKRVPSLKLALDIEREFGVPTSYWHKQKAA